MALTRLCTDCNARIRTLGPRCTRCQREHRGSDQREFRREVMAAAGGVCAKCGRKGRLQADHIKPLKGGGLRSAKKNGQALCLACHKTKTARENSRRREQ